jgi:hypothetical protein
MLSKAPKDEHPNIASMLVDVCGTDAGAKVRRALHLKPHNPGGMLRWKLQCV